MYYSYYAKKVSGEEKRGEITAKDKFELARMLREQGYTLVFCKERVEKKTFSFDFLKLFGGVSSQEKILFSRNLGVMISAGLSLVRSLEILSRQTKNKKFKNIIIAIMEKVQKGVLLSEALKDHPKIFSILFVAMVKVGEESGRLNESLKLISDQMERDHTLVRKIKGALIYPAVVMTAMIIIGILMLIYVVPTLVSTFVELNIQLPASTRAVIFVSSFIVNHTFLTIVTLAFLILFSAWALRTEKGKRILANILLRLPIFSGLVKKINSARTSRTLSSLVSSGINILEALTITKDVVQNYHYKEVLDMARENVQRGAPLSETFKAAEKLYPILVGEMMAVGEETGKISEMLGRVAVFYEEEVAEATKDMSTIIEPLLMIIIGVIVGFFAVSMIKPMYSMMSGM